ncbi:hypothetical protein AB4P97_08195 [Pseudomonas sp. A1230]|uniref:hypothetical protein n=1 Tax=Pseudomonas sp. A1230 TaxID=3235106 RepID=UPI00378408D5
MTIENVVMTLNRIPEIRAVVDSGTDWTVVLGFGLTIFAVLAGSWVSVSTYKKSVSSQEKLARAVAVKESRQNWINELRNTCADYIAAICIMQVHTESRDIHQSFIAKVDSHDPSAAATLVESWGVEKRRLMMSVFSLGAKIQLLSNPDEPAFQKLSAVVQRAADQVSISKGGAMEACEEIISLSQRIMKTEWERAKRME